MKRRRTQKERGGGSFDDYDNDGTNPTIVGANEGNEPKRPSSSSSSSSSSKKIHGFQIEYEQPAEKPNFLRMLRGGVTDPNDVKEQRIASEIARVADSSKKVIE
jgi:hypothetical protein